MTGKVEKGRGWKIVRQRRGVGVKCAKMEKGERRRTCEE